METILSLNKKNTIVNDRVKEMLNIVKEKFDNNEQIHTFTNKDSLVNFLKDNIPVNDKSYTVIVDKDLDSTQKLLLKHSTEKAAIYQKKTGFDSNTYEFKKNVSAAFENSNISLEEKSDHIAATAAEYEDPSNKKKISRALCSIMAEYSVEIYNQIFGGIENPENKDGNNTNEKVLSNLKNTLNLLIQNNYETHMFKSKSVDIVSLRNNISRIFMNKMYKIKKKINSNETD